jgi:hypothetical protein
MTTAGAQGFAPLRDPALRAAVLEVVPDADLERASALGEGWGCIAYRVPTPAGDLALRVPKYGSWWAAPDLEREATLLRPWRRGIAQPAERRCEVRTARPRRAAVDRGAPAMGAARNDSGALCEALGGSFATVPRPSASPGVRAAHVGEHYAPPSTCRMLRRAAIGGGWRRSRWGQDGAPVVLSTPTSPRAPGGSGGGSRVWSTGQTR